jgi:hypothetical protein
MRVVSIAPEYDRRFLELEVRLKEYVWANGHHPELVGPSSR